MSTALHDAVAAVCPILSVASFEPMGDAEFNAMPAKWPDALLGRRGDGSAWRVDVLPTATAAQRAAAIEAAAAFDVRAVALRAYAAAKRFTLETAGIAVAGAAVATDRPSQAMIAGAFNFVAINPDAVLKWKGAGGFVALNKAAIEAIAQAVGVHVQACFAKEAEVVAAIDALTTTTTAQIDAAFSAL